ncbi:hypothetical protein Pcinc_028556 [Petrolisthes cinctipes]|uniref:Small ribosomal subunit protein mS26 n=1 Tax=Petrolisthes cinctipes TaxID=88211 RepID=A0AAE1F3D4_PETCI|nr:hypothetical protein Pcinc_028556 [Petrolisthes cinctipes]
MFSAVKSNVVNVGRVNRLWLPLNDVTVTLAGVQSVRRKRKPLWLPPAKSKMFKIPPRKYIPEEESRELLRLYNNYRTQMKIIRRHLKNEVERTAATSELALQQAAEEEAEHQALMEYNLQENLRVAALREKRVQKEFEAEMARVEATKKYQEERALLAEEEAMRIITETQEFAKSFIKREDLEQAIETAIANPVDYNFAVDNEGHVFRGRLTKPQDTDEKDWEKLPATAMQ